MDAAVEIAADRVEWSAGVAAAEGHVTVLFGDQALVGARATWDGTTVVVERGEYRRPDGVFAFDRAEVRPRDGSGVVVAARVETGGATVEAGTLTVGETWTAADATVVPCRCADGGPPALSFTAARIEVVPDEVVILHGGVVRIFRAPVLPVPYWRVPLDPHRFRLLLPELGWGAYGPSAAVKGRVGAGDWFVEAGPAWRADSGFRGEVAVTGPGTRAEGALGWDTRVGALRGAAASRGGVDGGVRAGWDVAWVSDAAYLDDYSVDYVARGVAWRESRAVLSAFDGALALDGWLPDDGSVGALARVRGAPTFGRGPLRVTPRFGLEAFGGLDGALTPVAELGVGGVATGALAWLQVEARADLSGRAAFGADGLLDALPDAPPAAPVTWGEGFALGPLARWGTGATGLFAAASTSASVPFWSTVGDARLQWWPGVRAEVRSTIDADGATAAATRAGPSARVTMGTATGGIGLDTALLHDGTTLRPAAALDVSVERLAARLQLDPDVQAGEIRWMPGPVTLAVGTTRADALWLAWGDAALAWKRLRVGGGAAWDLDGNAFSGADARLGYDDGCAAATLSARFAPDRVLPDVGLSATLRR